MTRLAVNRIELNVEDDGHGPVLLMLHGFTGDHTTWDPFVHHEALQGYRKIRIDLIGHGRSDSPHDPARYSMAHAVDDITAVVDQLGVDRYALLGYSLGGRVALHVALADTDRLWGLVLESASPGIADAAGRLARRRSDVELCRTLWEPEEQLGEPPAGLHPFIDRWQEQPLFASQQRLPAEVLAKQRAVRLSQSPQGLANSLRGMGAGSQDYLLPAIASSFVFSSLPTLLLAGELDTKYVEAAQEMAPHMACSATYVFENAGHAAHLEQPENFARTLGVFLFATLAQAVGDQHMEKFHGS